MSSITDKYLWTSTSDTSATTSSTYAQYVRKVDLDLSGPFKDLKVHLTKKRDEIRKEKKTYMFNPDDLVLEGGK